ncbi:MAG: hypothetical protein JWN70_3633 [Planctomycetaceae bacterium]|nr:hypothetical protein [Planctomycetaceae bacterium]
MTEAKPSLCRFPDWHSLVTVDCANQDSCSQHFDIKVVAETAGHLAERGGFDHINQYCSVTYYSKTHCDNSQFS